MAVVNTLFRQWLAVHLRLANRFPGLSQTAAVSTTFGASSVVNIKRRTMTHKTSISAYPPRTTSGDYKCCQMSILEYLQVSLEVASQY
jgi:hypothetical protein